MAEDSPTRARLAQPVVVGGESSDGAPRSGTARDGRSAVSLLLWQDLLEEELAPIRETVARLEARQGEDEALRAATSERNEHISYLQARVDAIEALAESRHVDLQHALDQVEAELSRLNEYALRGQIDINQIRADQARTVRAISRLTDEQIAILNQLLGRLSTLQSDLSQQRSRLRGLLIVVGATIIAVIGIAALLLAPYFL